MSRESGSTHGQRTVAELLAAYGGSDQATPRRHRRRAEDGENSAGIAPQTIIDRVLSDSGTLLPVRDRPGSTQAHLAGTESVTSPSPVEPPSDVPTVTGVTPVGNRAAGRVTNTNAATSGTPTHTNLPVQAPRSAVSRRGMPPHVGAVPARQPQSRPNSLRQDPQTDELPPVSENPAFASRLRLGPAVVPTNGVGSPMSRPTSAGPAAPPALESTQAHAGPYVDDDDDDFDSFGLAEPLHQVKEDLSKAEPESKENRRSVDESVELAVDHPRLTPKEWLMMGAQVGIGVGVGAVVWLGFSWLWGLLPVAALVAAVVAIVGLVFMVRRLPRADDVQTIVLAIAAGLVVTVSPAVLLLLHH